MKGVRDIKVRRAEGEVGPARGQSVSSRRCNLRTIGGKTQSTPGTGGVDGGKCTAPPGPTSFSASASVGRIPQIGTIHGVPLRGAVAVTGPGVPLYTLYSGNSRTGNDRTRVIPAEVRRSNQLLRVHGKHLKLRVATRCIRSDRTRVRFVADASCSLSPGPT
jgi:hypothetical protein